MHAQRLHSVLTAQRVLTAISSAVKRRMKFARIDQSPVARWWWTVDRWSLAALGMLIGFGVVMSLAASPPVAERIGYDGLHFVRRHLAMLPLALGLMFAVSLQPPRTIRRIAVIGFGISLALLALTFVIGVEIKGARRWINLPGPVAAAFRIRQADLCGRRRVAVFGAEAAPALSRQSDLHGAVSRDRRDADKAAGHRHGGGRRRRLVRPVLHGRAAALLGRGGRSCRARRTGRRLYVPAACQGPGRPLPRSLGRRQLSGQPLDRGLRQWRAMGPRSGRRHGQGRPPRRPCRFCLRRRRGRVRRGRLPRHRRAVRVHRAARIFADVAGGQSFRPARRDRACWSNSDCRRRSTWPPACT